MIVASLLLILVAVTLLVLGLANGSSPLLVGSIAASLFAAIALVIGARQAAAARAAADDHLDDGVGERDAGGTMTYRPPARDRRAAGAGGTADVPDQRTGGVGTATAEAMTEPFPAVSEDPTPPGGVPMMSGPPAAHPSADEYPDDEDPPDEPAPQAVTAADAARVARLSTEVLVIDGRPRYHLAGCVHLLGRESEPLPVSEAVELGFSPCSLCEPDTALLTEARR